ncbi:hypothetical protein L3X38_037605 [Prunus dulcis]|uniref:Uncharacterized protein n=1 Tax=Prunus dulcis TaxID=3755 RepID=A0AAD4V427_PRUDU|nr:hypothetical protein L3X38_037605 [Prunus dulcis]
MDGESRKNNGNQCQSFVHKSEGYFVEAESLEETENVSSLQYLDDRIKEITMISRHCEYDELNFQNMSIADLEGREFAKFEKAERFYWNYALAIGFSIRRSRLRRCEGGVVIRRHGCA